MKRYLYILLLLLPCTSCNNWLSLDAEDEIDSDYLLSSPQGFRNALNGIYINLAREELYGKELTWGLLSALSQYYDPSFSTTYKAAMEYDYEQTSVNTIISNIWLKTYNAIANCNNLIVNIPKHAPDEFELGGKERDLLLGEALGLRAILHFDMLRLFAPAPITGDNSNYIPYYSTYPAIVEPNLTVENFMKRVITDLLKARELVATHDSSNKHLESLDARFYANLMPGPEGGTFFDYRGTHFNLYAADALLARAYLYIGDKEKAYHHASYLYENHVIKAKHLKLTAASDITSNLLNRSRKLYDGIILAFHSKKLLDLYEEFRNKNKGEIPLKNTDEIFKEDLDDYRFLYLIVTNNKDHLESIKYQRADEQVNNVNSKQGPLLPIIRLSEIYYIMCECLVNSDKDKAVDLLNELRLARGCKRDIPKTISAKDFMEEIIRDARKDFIGEGQIYYMYKRLNRPVLDGNKEITMGTKFILPLPDNQTIH